MTEGIQGRGELSRNGETVCRVSYQLQRHEGSNENRFTLTDGVIEIEEELVGGEAFDLQPGQTYTLALEKPLRDGRRSLTVAVEPYEGHRPDERYQVSIQETSE